MAFITFKLMHFILKFRDFDTKTIFQCQSFTHNLRSHSHWVMVQAFLSQSIYLLTNISNCNLTFLFFLCLAYTLAQTHDKTQASFQSCIQSTITVQNYTKTAISRSQVKLFYMHQDLHTTIHNQKYKPISQQKVY